MFPAVVCSVLGLAALTAAQTIPNTYPHSYPGMPSGGYDPKWQAYFEVTDPLPNVTEKLPRNFAGNIAVDRPHHPSNTLFFWGWENKPGSLSDISDKKCKDPWFIWLNGGPGSSSMIGLMIENGHLHFNSDYSISINNRSWDRIADGFWVDQPAGTGFSTADSKGYVADEDQMGQDFVGFLRNLVLVFPTLRCRPLYLIGESYAGVFVPYITKTLFSIPHPPVNLKGIAMGDATVTDLATSEQVPTVETIETYPAMIDFDNDVYKFFIEQLKICKYDIKLAYPQKGLIPTPIDPFKTIPPARSQIFSQNKRARFGKSLKSIIADGIAAKTGGAGLTRRDLEKRGQEKDDWKRKMAALPKGTLDPWYGCFLFDEMVDYAVNFTEPWKSGRQFDVYDIPDALSPEAPIDPTGFMNDNRTRTALHAPTVKDWTFSFRYPFGSTHNHTTGNAFGDPSPPSMTFMTELAANASARGVSIVMYSGNDDALVAHKGTQIAIQNMTFGGVQGFTRKPQTAWHDDEGNFAGIIHQERGVTYALFIGAGHLVPQKKPDAAWTFLRDFIIGDNPLGRVIDHDGNTTVVGGEDPALGGDILPGADAIFYGSGATMASLVAPSLAYHSWFDMLKTATLERREEPTATVV